MDATFIREFHWHEFLWVTLLRFLAMLVTPVWRIFRKPPPRAPSPYVKCSPQSLVVTGLCFIWVLLLYVAWPSPYLLGIFAGSALTIPVENLLPA